MKYFIILSTLIAANLFAQARQNPETGWEFEISTLAAYYYFEALTVDGTAAVGDGGIGNNCADNLNTCDVIGTFVQADDGSGEICIGWQYANAAGFSEVAAMGDDGGACGCNSAGYAVGGEVPSFKLYDASNGSILDITPAGTVDGWAISGLLNIWGTSTATNTFGCTDAGACNQTAGATADDGSCWFANTGCSCSDAQGSTTDCLGVCNGSAVDDDCGVCDGGNASQDCAGVCDGPSTEDNCGVCDADVSNDDVSCTGCMNSDADNYNAGNSIEDGSCVFTVNQATNLTTNPGPARMNLNWEAPVDAFTQSSAGYEYDIYVDGIYNKTTSQLSTQIGGLDSATLYCFTVLAVHKEYGDSATFSNESCNTPGEATGDPTWRIQVTAEIDSYDQFQFSGNADWLLYDTQNFLGVASDASYGWDSGHDAPDPPQGPGNYIKLFFDHPEWGVWVTHFTEDIVFEDHAFFSSNLTQWNIRVQSDVPGATVLRFKTDIGVIPANYELYAELDGNYIRLDHSAETAIEFYMDGSGQQDLAVYIGNIVPQSPDNLTITDPAGDGNYNTLGLDWDSDGNDLNDIGNRYPATSYNVYRDDEPADYNTNTGSPGTGPGGCGGLLTPGSGQTATDYFDEANLYPDESWAPIVDDLSGSERLLQESTYSYTVTGNNDAGESSEGHTVRLSGGSDPACTGVGVNQDCAAGSYDGDTWNDGRGSWISATTGPNADPTSLPVYMDSPNGSNNCSDVLAGCDNGSWDWTQGIYEIPHNNDTDANRIAIQIGAWGTNDTDFPYAHLNYFDYYWTECSGPEACEVPFDDLTDIVGLTAAQLNFKVAHTHENAAGEHNTPKSYTWNLRADAQHPVRYQGAATGSACTDPCTDLSCVCEADASVNNITGDTYYSGCGGWTTWMDTHSDNADITVVIRPEPNSNPIAADARDLPRFGDGASVVTSDQYDNIATVGNDFNDYEAAAASILCSDASGNPLANTECGNSANRGDLCGAGETPEVDDCDSGEAHFGVWYEPHDNNIVHETAGGIINYFANMTDFGNNNAELYFTAMDSDDLDGMCDGTDPVCADFGNPGDFVDDCDDTDCCPSAWIGDGICDGVDQIAGCNLNCAANNNDGGDCDANANQCPFDPDTGLQLLEDCSGDGDCAPEDWVGDTYCDGTDQAWGYDLTCYNLNGSGEVEGAVGDTWPNGGDGGDCAAGRSADDGGTPNRDAYWIPDTERYTEMISGNSRAASTFCDEQSYEWFYTKGSAAAFNYLDLNSNGIYDIGERFSLIDNNAIVQEFTPEEFWDDNESGFWDVDEEYVDDNGNGLYDVGTDLGNYLPPNQEQFGACSDDGGGCTPGSFDADDDSEGVGFYGHGQIDLHAEFQDNVYILTLKVTDAYNDVDYRSLLFVVKDERNSAPVANEHRSQPTAGDAYYVDYNEDTKEVSVRTIIDGSELGVLGCSDDLGAVDTDNDSLTYVWTYAGDGMLTDAGNSDLSEFNSAYTHSNGATPSGWLDASANLNVGTHTFTFTVTDSYNATSSESTTFDIREEPTAANPTVVVDSTDLKYTIIHVEDEILAPFTEDDCYGEVYNGAHFNTQRIILINTTVNAEDTIAVWEDGDGVKTDNFPVHIDKYLEAETYYEYKAVAYNSNLVPEETAFTVTSTTTHDRPQVTVDTPNGAEIRSIGDNYDVDFSTTQKEYISKIEVFYLPNGVLGDANYGEITNAACDAIADAVWYPGEGGDPGVCGDGFDDGEVAGENSASNPVGSANGGENIAGVADSDGDLIEGDATENFEISDNVGTEINYNAKVVVRVWDTGNYDGGNVQFHDDVSDYPFTMAAHLLTNDFLAGWHLLGPPLTPWNDNLVENFGGSLGNWGAEWVAYDVAGYYDALTLRLGEGYYLALANNTTLVQEGDPIIGDPDCAACLDNSFSASDLSLFKGWNLVANPLVNKVSKFTFTINDGSGDLDFEDAVDEGWIAPTIYGWFENSYVSIDRIMPFDGYWINTSRDLTIKVRPHLFENGELTRKAEDMVTSVLELRARDISGDGISDFITVGLAENAVDEFVYGEDEYDLPRQAYVAMGGEFIDLKVGSDLMRDMKSAEYDDYQAWTISIESEKVDNDIELSWGDVSGFEADLHIVINGEAINMHEENYIELTSMIKEVAIVVGNVDAYLNPIPVEFGLSAAYPNPFNPTTNLGLALNADGFVSMSVYNIRGQVVEVLVDRNMNAGYHNITWNADGISSGMYFVRVETGANSAIQKLMLLK